MCCCQKQLSHDESMKFMLMHNENQEDKVIFEEREAGYLMHLNDVSYVNQMSNIYDSSILIGRNFDIQQIACKLTIEKDNRITTVVANKGMRKKYIVIQAVKYCI